MRIHAASYHEISTRSKTQQMRSEWRIYWAASKGHCVIHNNTQYRVDSKTIVLIPPNTAIQQTLQSTVHSLFLHITLDNHGDRVNGKVFSISVTPELSSLLPLVQAVASQRPLSEQATMLLKSYAYRLVSLLPRQTWELCQYDHRIEAILRNMESHPEKQQKNELLSSKSYMSKSAFIRLFTREVGLSPQIYLCRLRLSRAATDLLKTDETIDTIALKWGFYDRSHFSRAFKERYKCRPGEYRQERLL